MFIKILCLDSGILCMTPLLYMTYNKRKHSTTLIHSNLFTIDLAVVYVKCMAGGTRGRIERGDVAAYRLMSMREKHARKRVIKKN